MNHPPIAPQSTMFQTSESRATRFRYYSEVGKKFVWVSVASLTSKKRCKQWDYWRRILAAVAVEEWNDRKVDLQDEIQPLRADDPDFDRFQAMIREAIECIHAWREWERSET